MRAITIRNFLKKARPWAVGAIAGLLLATGVGVFAQPGQSPNFAWLRGAALGSDPALVCQGLDTNVDCNIVTQGTGTLLLNGAALPGVSGGAGIFSSLTVNPGPVTITGNSSLTGTLAIQPGTSVGNKLVGARVFHNVTDAPTTGTVIETLYTYAIPANLLAVNGQSLTVEIWATTAANANNKTLTVVFGATTIGTSTAAGFNGETMSMRCNIYRVTNTTQKARCNFQSFTSGTLTANQNAVITAAAPGETLSGPVNLLVRGTTPTAAADLTANVATVDWYPVGQ